MRVAMISDIGMKLRALYLDPLPKLAKGLIRLGHDARLISYGGILRQLSRFKSRTLSGFLYKKKVDHDIATLLRHYLPDIVLVCFAKFLDAGSVQCWRSVCPKAQFIGLDVDLWPHRHPGRLETAAQMDALFATNAGSSLQAYRDAGVARCYFLPNCCDPDVECRYSVGAEWHSNLLWTGKVRHKGGGDDVRQQVIARLVQRSDAAVYGCLGRPTVEGIDYLYAISGAKIGISINADNTIPLYHSDRFTQYAACGTMVLAKRVPQTEKLMEDKKHVVYFDTADECFELADWYLRHDAERQKIADAGMARCRTVFSGQAVAAAMLELTQNGKTNAEWG